MKQFLVLSTFLILSICSYAIDNEIGISAKERSYTINLHELRYARLETNTIREAMNKSNNDYVLFDSSNVPLLCDSSYWIKFEIRNLDTSKTNWIIDLGWIGYAKAFVIDKRGSMQTGEAGRISPSCKKQTKEIGNEVISFSLNSLETKTIYLHCKVIDETTSINSIHLTTQDTYEVGIKFLYLRYGIYFGILFLVINISLFLAIFLRSQVYLLFTFFLSSMLVYIAYLLNVFKTFFYEINTENLAFELLTYSAIISYASLIKFFFQHNRMNTWFKWMRRIWQILIVISAIWTVVNIFDPIDFFKFHNTFISIHLLIGAGMTIFALQSYNKASRFLIAGLCITIIAASIIHFCNFVSLSGLDLFAGSIVIEAILVAAGIMMSYREVEKNRTSEIQELVTALQQQEIQLKETNNKLEIKVKERTAEIQDKNKRLQEHYEQLDELNKLKTRFLSIIGHDLKNPLGTIIGFSQMLYENIDSYNREKIKKYAEQIHLSTTNTYDLLINLLEWARSQTNAIKYSPEPANLFTLIEETLNLLQETANQKAVTIQIEAEKNQRVMIDVNMIKTVLRNIISNSIKYSKYGGTINITASVALHAAIKIRDNGIGMSEEQIKKLFRIDEHCSTPGTEHEKGTGLGLIITHEFIQRMNGTIYVESKPDEGTIFTIIIPAGLPSE